MRRFELRDGEVDKFWEIERQGALVRFAWGKAGSTRFTREKLYDSEANAKSAVSAATQARREDGYVGANKAAEAHVRAADNPRLFAAIEADPSAADAYAIYADWLETREDPRGELINLHLAARGASARATRARAEAAELLARHEEHFYGQAALVVGQQLHPEWELGFLRAIDWYNDEGGDPEQSLGTLMALLEHPSSRLLRDLSILMNDNDRTLWAQLLPRLAAKHVSHLRLAAIHAGALHPLLSTTKLPALTHLTLVAVTGDFVTNLARSRLLRQLREVDLHDAIDSDEQAHALLVHATRFEHLDALVVARSSVTPGVFRRLTEDLPVKVRSRHKR